MSSITPLQRNVINGIGPYPSAVGLKLLSDSDLIAVCSMYAGGDIKIHELCDRLTLANMRLTQIETLHGEIYGVLKCVKP